MDQLKNSAQNKPDILYVLKSFRFFFIEKNTYCYGMPWGFSQIHGISSWKWNLIRKKGWSFRKKFLSFFAK